MTEVDEVAAGFEGPPADAKLEPPPPGASFVCPDCGEEFISKFKLGGHRWHKHGVRSATSKRTKTKTKTTRSPAARSNTGGSPTQAQLLKEARVSLAAAMETGGEMMVLVMPIPGTYCISTADDFADAMIKVAAKNPKMLKWLVQGGMVMDYAALGSWTLGLGVALAVQTGRLSPDTPIARRRGITDIFYSFYTPLPEGAEPHEADEGVNDVVDGNLGPAGRPRAVPVPDLLVGSVGASTD